jgi:flagellar basal-body rod protein FlgC
MGSDLFGAMDILASGLHAERVRMNTSASNLANAQTTRTAEGGPYKRQDPVFVAQGVDGGSFESALDGAMAGVEVSEVRQDQSAPKIVYDPAHPDANADGYVAMPNVNTVEEMVNMLTATRAYEANSTAMQSLISMAEKALTLGK